MMTLKEAALWYRIRAACCEESGLTDEELERHVALIVEHVLRARKSGQLA